MKNIILGFVLSFAIILSSCETSDERSGKEIENVEDSTETPVDSLSKHSKNLKNLVKTEDGIFRGIDFGTPAAEVKKMEDTVAVEETKDHLDYSVNYGELESADIRYLLDANALVSGMEVYIYPKSKESQSNTFDELKTYYSNKYGSPVASGPNNLRWENTEKNILILMEKKDNQKVHDIKVVFSNLTKQSASAQ